MSDFDYAEFAATATELLTEAGQVGALRRAGAPAGPAYDPTPGADTDYPATFAVVKWGRGEVDGSRVVSTDKKVLLSATGLQITPSPSDKLVIGGVAHSIVGDTGLGIQTLAPAEIVVMYTLQVRR